MEAEKNQPTEEKESLLKKINYFNLPIPDNYRKFFFPIYGDYRPSIFKRAICHLFDEKLYPIDWEEVPPFEDYVDLENDLIKRKSSPLLYIECRSQPDMLSEGNILFRKFAFISVGYGLYRFLERNRDHFSKYIFLGHFYYDSKIMKYFLVFWIWNVFCLKFANRNNQLPYNTF